MYYENVLFLSKEILKIINFLNYANYGKEGWVPKVKLMKKIGS